MDQKTLQTAHQADYREVAYQTNGLDVEVYDARFEAGDPLLAGDAEFYIDYARRYKRYSGGGPVLELGSGTGRITWALAGAGVDVLGLELSESMVEIARRKRAVHPTKARKNCRFVVGDMTDFKLGETFPLIIIPARTFQCLETDAQQRACLQCIHRHLAPGGRLIVDIFDPRFDPMDADDWAADAAKVPTVRHPRTGNVVEIEFLGRDSDMYNQLIEETWRYRELGPDGAVVRIEDARLRMRWALRQEMKLLFELTGFTVEDEFSDFKKSPPAYGKEQVWVVKKA